DQLHLYPPSPELSVSMKTRIFLARVSCSRIPVGRRRRQFQPDQPWLIEAGMQTINLFGPHFVDVLQSLDQYDLPFTIALTFRGLHDTEIPPEKCSKTSLTLCLSNANMRWNTIY